MSDTDRSRRKRNLTLDTTTLDILAEQGNASRYVDQLVQDAERDWLEALRALREAGWRGAEMIALCDVLNGYWAHGPPTWIAQEMHDAQALNRTAERHDVSPERWAELTRQAAEHTELARACITLAREFWRMNPRVERVILGS